MATLKCEETGTITIGWLEKQKKLKQGVRVKLVDDPRWWKVVEIFTNVSLEQKDLDTMRIDSVDKRSEIK